VRNRYTRYLSLNPLLGQAFYIYNTKEEIDRFVEVLKEFESALMTTVTDYVASIEGTCGAESDVIVVFRMKERRSNRQHHEKSHSKKQDSRHNFRVNLKDASFRLYEDRWSFRLYTSGKAMGAGGKISEMRKPFPKQGTGALSVAYEIKRQLTL
jgi:ribosomal protein L28